jgi:hypothetical protein
MSEHEKVTKDIIPHAQMISMYIGQWRRVDGEYTKALDLLREVSTYLNDKIAVLPCESRQRDLPEDEWGHLMFLRDKLDKFLGRDA